MTTSKHAVLFTKENCGPCSTTKYFVLDFMEEQPDLGEHLSIMKIENHTALREAYGLNKFPTLLITGPGGIEMDRVVGGAAIRECVEERLIDIAREVK